MENREIVELEALLDRVGLELWQSPEGWWAVRLRNEPRTPPDAEASQRRDVEVRG